VNAGSTPANCRERHMSSSLNMYYWISADVAVSLYVCDA
jgi:hypothetical protein